MDNLVPGPLNPVNSFRFQLVNRFVDELSGCVRYTKRDEYILSVPIPMELCKEVLNFCVIWIIYKNYYNFVSLFKSDVSVNGVKRKTVSFENCLSKCFADEQIDDYFSPVLKEKGKAQQALRMGSFPDFLIIQLRVRDMDEGGIASIF